MRSYEYVGRYISDLQRMHLDAQSDRRKLYHIANGGRVEDFDGFASLPPASPIRGDDLVVFFMVGVDNIGGAAKTAP